MRSDLGDYRKKDAYGRVGPWVFENKNGDSSKREKRRIAVFGW